MLSSMILVRAAVRLFKLNVCGAMRTFRVKSPPWAIFGEMGELLGDGFPRGMGGCFVELGGKPR